MYSGKLADHVGDHVVLSPEGAILVTPSGTKSSYPRPSQSLNPSLVLLVRIRFHNRFICVGVDISIYALLTGGRS